MASCNPHPWEAEGRTQSKLTSWERWSLGSLIGFASIKWCLIRETTWYHLQLPNAHAHMYPQTFQHNKKQNVNFSINYVTGNIKMRPILLRVYGRGKLGFLQWSNTGYINHTPRQASGSEVVDQHKSNSVGFACVCFLLLLLFCCLRKDMKLHEWSLENLGT